MAEKEFIPYWRRLTPPEGPNSWVFFAVAEIAGRHRPIAVVSSVGDSEPLEGLQGYPLTACCRRIVTIFSDPGNHAAVRAELALASTYYRDDDDGGGGGGGENQASRLVSTELPYLHRLRHTISQRRRPWDHDRVHEFPFIAACLLQGVAFDAQSGRCCPTLVEPLGTVYRDSSIEWGMAVVDITNLDDVRYGIVGFPVCTAKFTPSRQAELRDRSWPGATGPGAAATGELILVDEPHHRQAMSASEYMAKFDYEKREHGDAVEALSQVPLVSADSMSLVWPPASEEKAVSPPVMESTAWDSSLQLQRLMEVRRHRHLSLERLAGISTNCIAAALNALDSDPENPIASISINIDTIRSTPAELVKMLSKSRGTRLRKIIFIQSPDRKADDDLSVRVFAELATRSRMLSRTEVILTGAYSAALRKRFWLPTIARGPNAVQLAPLDVFPMQQILVRHQSLGIPNKFSYECMYLGDGLLKPDKFAAGFLIFLATLLEGGDSIFDSKAQLFSFSSSPSSPAADLRTSAQISPILAENFALPVRFSDPDGVPWPRVRDLVPEGWTVVVSLQVHWIKTAPPVYSYSIRYAFIRPRHQRIIVDPPTSQPLSPEDFEVVGLREFLSITAPDMDLDIIDRRLREVAEIRAKSTFTGLGVLPSNIDPLSVFTGAQVVELLPDFMSSAKKLHKDLREDMKKKPDERNWYYPELLKEG
ncbi:hypothetical protein F5Y12DRAFT_786816 [Xylaria sp. FL1777]|nr:hypothetical protein F5Y12DRAFT_786816 [Xylaria sp. FL1777]